MKREFIHTAIRTVLPALMGMVGALLATAAPAYHKALCASPYLGL
ncbi:hypothetical protein [Flyfo microvirus Tbat2_93]|nr:hypothetical protein [Flyfo microvirus Tbat2_93]